MAGYTPGEVLTGIEAIDGLFRLSDTRTAAYIDLEATVGEEIAAIRIVEQILADYTPESGSQVSEETQ